MIRNPFNIRVHPALVLMLILAGATFLRLYHIGEKPVWYDEAVSIAHAERPLEFYFSSPRVNYKPAYFFFLNRWMLLFNEDVFFLRFFSVIWGVFNIFVIYKLSSELFDRKTGILSAFLLSISVFHIFHCQQIRQFSIVALFATLSVYYFLRYFRSSRWLDLAALAVINIILIHIYPTGYCVVFCEGIAAFLYFRGELLRRWLLLLLAVGVVAFRWSIVIEKQHIKEMVWWISKPDFRSFVETFHTFSWGGGRYGLDDFNIIPNHPWLMGLLSLIYLAMLTRGFMRNKEGEVGVSVIILWLLIPIGALFVASLIGNVSFYAIKHTMISLPAFCILSAKGLSGLGRAWRAIILGLIIFLSLFPLSAMYNNDFAPDWKGSTSFLRENINQGDTVIISSLSEVIIFMYYFERKERSLEDVDIYGRINADSSYSNVFRAGNDNLIIGVKQTGFADNTVSAETDFLHKFSGLSAEKRRPVWTMLSRWSDSNIRTVIFDYLGKYFNQIDCRYFTGVETCYFELK